MTAHSSILAWKILWTEEPGSLQSMESQRVYLRQCYSLNSALRVLNQGELIHSSASQQPFLQTFCDRNLNVFKHHHHQSNHKGWGRGFFHWNNWERQCGVRVPALQAPRFCFFLVTNLLFSSYTWPSFWCLPQLSSDLCSLCGWIS